METENKKETERVESDTEYYLGNSDKLKQKIASMSIDMSGTMEGQYMVLLRVSRGGSYKLMYYQNGSDGYNNDNRFWWEFPMFFYRDMPSGYFIRDGEEGFLLVDENDKPLQKIGVNELMNVLIDDLIERNYKGFNDNWDEFLTFFQKWINEEMKLEKVD
jgi:hypothetical protein